MLADGLNTLLLPSHLFNLITDVNRATTLGLLTFSELLLSVMISYSWIQVNTNMAQAAQQGFSPDLVPTRWRGTSAGLKGFMDFSGALLGYAILGTLLGTGQTGMAIIAISIVLITTLVLTISLVREPLQPESPMPTRFGLKDIFQLNLRQHHPFAWLIGSRFVFLLGSYTVIRFFLFFVLIDLTSTQTGPPKRLQLCWQA